MFRKHRPDRVDGHDRRAPGERLPRRLRDQGLSSPAPDALVTRGTEADLDLWWVARACR